MQTDGAGAASAKVHEAVHPDLLALLAHQFITPLTQIDSSAQRMIHSVGDMTPDEIKVRATRMRRTVAQLSALVQSLLLRTQFDGRSELQHRDCDWTELVLRACEQVRDHQPERRFSVRSRKGAGSFRGDPFLMAQVFEILIGNAAKYSPLGSPIEITGFAIGNHLAIAVKDYGIGIPKEDLSFLFQPFFRSRNTGSVNGLGLGLNLAAQIVEAHGGTIQIVSREGRGSTFSVLLPVDATSMQQDGEQWEQDRRLHGEG